MDQSRGSPVEDRVEQTVLQTGVKVSDGLDERLGRDGLFEENFEVVVVGRENLVDKAKFEEDSGGGGTVFQFFDGVHLSQFHNPQTTFGCTMANDCCLVAETSYPVRRGLFFVPLLG